MPSNPSAATRFGDVMRTNTTTLLWNIDIPTDILPNDIFIINANNSVGAGAFSDSLLSPREIVPQPRIHSRLQGMHDRLNLATLTLCSTTVSAQETSTALT